MARQFFKDLPDTSTPLTASRLNGLLDGEEAMGNLVVDSIKTKNMFDSSTIVQGDIVNEGPTLRMTSRQIIWLEPGTYTASTNMSSSYQWGIQIQNVGIPPLRTYPTYIYTTNWLNTGTTNHTFTINTAGWFTLMLRRSDNGSFTSTDITNLKGYNYQLETGEDATAYSPYQNLNPDTSYTYVTLSPINTTNFSGTITLRKYGKVVTLEIASFTINSLSANTWTDVANIPDEYMPPAEVRGSGLCDLLGINAIISNGKKLVINSRTNAVSGKGLYLNMSWIVE